MELLVNAFIGGATVVVNYMLIRANRQGQKSTEILQARQQDEAEKSGTYSRLEADLARLEKRAEAAEQRAENAEKRADRADDRIDKIAVSLAAHGQWDLLVLAEVRKSSPEFPDPPSLSLPDAS